MNTPDGIEVVPQVAFTDESAALALSLGATWLHVGEITPDIARTLFERADILLPEGLVLTANVKGVPGFEGGFANCRKVFSGGTRADTR